LRRLTLSIALAVALSRGFQADWLSTCDAKPALDLQRPIAGQATATLAHTTDSIIPHEQHQRVGGQLLQASLFLNPAPSLSSTSPIGSPQIAGNQFATSLLAMLERRSNVVARVRHRVHLGEYALIGSGSYWQQGVGNLRKTRLVLQTQIASESASLVQVFDGRYLWTDRQLPSGRKVTRLDPVRLQAGLAGGGSPITRQGRPTAATSLLSAAASRGSLCGQLADLIKQFDFQEPRKIPLNGTPMVAMIGHWKVAELERAWPNSMGPNSMGPNSKGFSHATKQTEGIHARDEERATQEILAHWPKQLPHHVLLLVGPQDLYPYIIEYRRADDAQLATSPTGLLPADDPMARYEHFEVRFAAQIDNRLFEMASSDIEWTDETGQLVKQLQALGQ
jgi:hypothetical protein